MGSVFSDCSGGRELQDHSIHRGFSLCSEGENGGPLEFVIGGREAPPRGFKLEGLMSELFRLHDLNGNGFLEEVELVKLNEKIAILHRGSSTDRGAVRKRYSGIFRKRLDPEGQPVPYPPFREYMFEILDGLDPDLPTQAMIMEQLIAEADLALSMFPVSLKIRCGSLASLGQPLQEDHLFSVQEVPDLRSVSLGGG
eukprot:CAMPEP_0170632136 /NCGR_PEP_ID=MMETSP0224-20130122/35114_1 /TAXON_ID=285029 /ORGANISM="Togula jolla, Strain CCCM 725" /LENGTH=196 /DNA_ID=CAMNT_0010960723 /DNA_START=42 /DNA_END=632 /DNA_ORIENTATION=+